MNKRWTAREIPTSMHLLFLGLFLIFLTPFLLVACNATSANKGGNTAAQASATAAAKCAQTTGTMLSAVGTLKSMSGQTLVLTDLQKKDVTITYSGSAHFTQQVSLAASALQEGTEVNITFTGDNGTYLATSITVIAGDNGTMTGMPPVNLNGTPGTIFNGTPPGGFVNGTPSGGSSKSNNPCANQVQSTPGNAGPGSTNSHGIAGKVNQVNGNMLTIIDTTGASYTMTLTSQTQIIGTQSATAAALQVGEPLSATGTKKDGVLAANIIQILLSLPTSTTTNG